MSDDKKGSNERMKIWGKEVKRKKVEKLIKHSPRLIGPILTNTFIILAIVVTILILIG